MEKNESFRKKYGEVVNSINPPPPRFGHTVNLISKTTAVVFGGAISGPGNYTMTADLYLYNMTTNTWKKLESKIYTNILALSSGVMPHARAAHASATVRENQMLVYGGSIGNGQYAQDDLWFLDIKNNEEASWMKVPIEKTTPGYRYGHSMVYIMPILILFGGSGKNEIMNDVWILSTDKTPFKWEKVQPKGPFSPNPRVYHSANLFKVAGNQEMMIVFGGRDKDNNSLNDIIGLKRDASSNQWEWTDFPQSDPKEVAPLARHQQCSAFFGPFLFVVGGRVGGKGQASFDVYSMNKFKWYRFGTISLFRHSIWIYYNMVNQEKYEVYLYIYGGFDGDNNSQINSKLYRINIVELFSQDESLENELADHISMLLLIQMQKQSRQKSTERPVTEGTKSQFVMNPKVVAFNMTFSGDDNFANNIRQLSLRNLAEESKKLGEIKSVNKKYVYDEGLVKEFIQLMPLPEQFVPLQKEDRPIILNSDYIITLIKNCKEVLQKTPTLLKLKYPIKIFGSIHGQYNDLIRYFNFWGRPHEHRGDIESFEYLFLGNMVNRGAFSLEVICLLMALKIKYPDQFHMLRGNQEEMQMCKNYGLAEECKQKLSDNIDSPFSVFQHLCDLFKYLPLAATINDKILCVHSGIGSSFKTIDDIAKLQKPVSVYDCPQAMDVLWNIPQLSSPDEEYPANNFTKDLRQRYFNEETVQEFLTKNKMSLIIRSHEVVEGGFEKIYDKKVITIFTATNYCGVTNNSGGILFIKKNSEIQPKILTGEDNFSVWAYYEPTVKNFPPTPRRSFKK